jgi:hypothetical protein
MRRSSAGRTSSSPTSSPGSLVGTPKASIAKLDYRVSVNHPFNTDDSSSLYRRDEAGNLVNPNRAFNIAADTLAYAGYFEWQFWDQESNLLPYKTSTWLGERSVFNLGAGFYFHPHASGILDAAGQLEKQHQLVVGSIATWTNRSVSAARRSRSTACTTSSTTATITSGTSGS